MNFECLILHSEPPQARVVTMGTEIERKFLVTSDLWKKGAQPIHYAQGYLSKEMGVTVRVRIAGEKAFLTIKGPITGISRAEFEYSIPLKDAEEMLLLSIGPLVEKNRHKIPFGGHLWEVDEFLGDNTGLVVAEVELSDAEEKITPPPWLGREVSGDPRYYNSNLSIYPYRQWDQKSPPSS